MGTHEKIMNELQKWGFLIKFAIRESQIALHK